MIINEKLIGLSFVKLGLGLFKKKLQLFHHGKRTLKKSLKAQITIAFRPMMSLCKCLTHSPLLYM